jgi:hypothetical protein
MEDKINALSNELPVAMAATEKVLFNKLDFIEIYHRLNRIQPQAYRQWGKMNVTQMLNHLKIATGSSLGVYRLKDESAFFLSKFMKFLLLRVFKEFPKNSKTVQGFKKEMYDVLDFEAEKEGALMMLEKAYASTNTIYIHPFFGKMSREDWGKLMYRHFDHHLRQFTS